MNDDLKKILEADILHLAGLEYAAPDIRERALADAKNHILRAVVQRIRRQLSPDLQTEFERLFGTEDDSITEKDMEFLKKHAPDLDMLIMEETLAFKKGAVDVVAEIKQKTADESEKINGILNGLKE